MRLSKNLKRFLIVGGITTSFNYLLFFLLWQWGIGYAISAIIGYCSGIAMGYILNKAWAFENTEKHSTQIIIQYIALYIITLGLNIATLVILVEWVSIHALIANIIAIGISTITNFLGLKFLIFAKNRPTLLAKIPPLFEQPPSIHLPPLKHPVVLLATWFGSGYIRLAPATVGTLAGMPIGYGIYAMGGQNALFVASGLALLGGVWACNAYSRLSNTHDSRHVVIDEVAAIWLVQAFIPQTILSYALAFVVFRLCDILKPFPINIVDEKVQGGWGMMLDDTMAGILSILILWGIHTLLPIEKLNNFLMALAIGA